MFTREILDFIARAEMKIIELSSYIVQSDGDLSKLPLALELADFLETLYDYDGTISDEDIIKTVHYLSQKADLNHLPVIELPTYKVYITDEEGVQREYQLVSYTQHGLMSKEDKIKLDGLSGNSLFLHDIVVSLANGKTLGRYVSGDVIPSAGKTPEEVMLLIAQEAINPTLTLDVTPNLLEYNDINRIITVKYTVIVKSLGAVLQHLKLERSRGDGIWVTVREETAGSTTGTYTGSVNPVADNRDIVYRLTALDSTGGQSVMTRTVSFKPYVAPTITLNAGATTREKGNISSTLVVGVLRQSPNINTLSAQVQVQMNGGVWTTLPAVHLLGATGGNFTVVHNDAAMLNAASIAYRVVVTDTQGTVTGNVVTVNLYSPRHFGYSALTAYTIADILGLPLQDVANSKVLEVRGVTAGIGFYTLYAYDADAGDLTNVIMDGAAPVLGAFQKVGDFNGVNKFGASVKLRLYRSNAPRAFTNNRLNFS